MTLREYCLIVQWFYTWNLLAPSPSHSPPTKSAGFAHSFPSRSKKPVYQLSSILFNNAMKIYICSYIV